MLEIKNISKSYGKTKALDNVSLKLTNGVYGLLGPNGAGKTTLIKILIGILEKDAGTIVYNDKAITKINADYLNQIGYMPQYPQFYKNFKVDEFLRYICALKNIKKDVAQRVDEVLLLVNLVDKKKALIGSLSGGMRQRLAIAQAILNDPKILILDEPTAGLDPKERIRFRNIISKLSKNRIIIFATHIVSDIELISQNIIILKEGKEIYTGSPSDLVATIQNKTWVVDGTYERALELMQTNIVSNIKNTDNKYTVKLLAKEKPFDDALQAQATLEDAFLYTFNE